MVRLAVQLIRHSGREALTRLLVTAAAVAVGVAILLAVLADFNAFRVTNDRACWECTQGPPVTLAGARPAAGAELWAFTEDIYAGQSIERLDVAALGPGAPLPPGIRALPGPGQYDASPALAALLRTVPRDQLGARFPGHLAGTIGDAALSGPTELVIYVGRTPAQLAPLPHTVRVTHITAATQRQVWSPYFRDLFVAAALAFLFPILVLIGTATRLAAARLEQRYAAMRLVGSTTRQISVIAAVDAVIGALIGVAGGIVVFTLLRPLLADTALTSARYFSADVRLSAVDYAAVIVGVPLASALAALISLRRVRISPLGVSRRVTPPAPRAWRPLLLAFGVLVFALGIALTGNRGISALVYGGLLLIMIGLVIAGPWLTERSARLLGRLGGPATLLALRRLSDNPRGAFRSVRGLVLAVFLSTVVATVLPVLQAPTVTPGARSLSPVLLDTFTYAPVCGNNVNCTGGPGSFGGQNADNSGGVAIAPGPGGGPGAPPNPAQEPLPVRIGLLGLPPATAATLLAQLRAIPGAEPFGVYSLPSGPGNGPGGASGVMTCASLRRLDALGQCAPGLAAVAAQTDNMYTDNPMFATKPFVDHATPGYTGKVSALYLQAVLVRTSGPAALERVRTFLATHTPLSESGTAPRTFGEAIAVRGSVESTVERLIFVAVALTLLVAGCSLAVAAGGGLVERRRPFALLRVAGTSAASLYRVVLLETVLPLAVATIVAAGVAYGVAVLAVGKLASAGTPTPVPGGSYYALVGTGLGVSLVVILLTLPLLGRMTGPASVRFE
jgi:hypothetical protein